jgi:hypothetical protein
MILFKRLFVALLATIAIFSGAFAGFGEEQTPSRVKVKRATSLAVAASLQAATIPDYDDVKRQTNDIAVSMSLCSVWA